MEERGLLSKYKKRTVITVVVEKDLTNEQAKNQKSARFDFYDQAMSETFKYHAIENFAYGDIKVTSKTEIIEK